MAKARIIVLHRGERFALLSRKRSPGKSKHDKLEMLGGHLDGNESPREALVRELREEERTGLLAQIAEIREPAFESQAVDGAPHHLFELVITSEEYASLEADPAESFGFELVSEHDLVGGRMEEALTPRTRKILGAYGSAAPIR